MFKLVSWDIAQQNIHDASGIDNPQDWLWSKLVGVYYPSMTMKQLSSTDYVVYNRQHQYALQFANGDIILYGNKAEAEADCQHGDIVIPCTKLPKLFQTLILKQINK